MARKTKEPQYETCLEVARQFGFHQLGLMSNQIWQDDPRRLTFVLSRYKFVAKMFSGFSDVLEVGCADGFASRLVRQEVRRLTAVDFDPTFIQDARRRMSTRWPVTFKVHDMTVAPLANDYDGIYAIDVLEHIAPEREPAFLTNLCRSLGRAGVLILGIPSLESQAYASPISRAGHVNCKSGPQFRETMQRYFANVFLFSMNDEVVHTGHYQMAHYLFALCCGPRRRPTRPATAKSRSPR
jgi:2-polyprenyl-3-methyl-5-hydroxy-6-metoxy-1,4-benzoquinol methylase